MRINIIVVLNWKHEVCDCVNCSLGFEFGYPAPVYVL